MHHMLTAFRSMLEIPPRQAMMEGKPLAHHMIGAGMLRGGGGAKGRTK